MATWIEVSWTDASLPRVRAWSAAPEEPPPPPPAPKQSTTTKQSTTVQPLAGGGPNSLTSFKPTVKREFFRVDDHGRRLGRTRFVAEPGVTPLDVVRKLAARLLPRSRSKSKQGASSRKARVPATVKTAVATAIRQNFMCNCDGKCQDEARCRERSVRKGMQYLDLYANDSSRTFATPLSIYIREAERTQVRQYEASYRLINNPTKACVRDGVNKEIVVRFVRAFRSQ